MANELTITSIADLFASEVIANEFLYTLAARDAGFLSHRAILRFTGNGRSNVVKVPHLGIGANLMSPVTPGAEVPNTDLDDDHTDVTVVHRALRRNVTDLARYVAAGKLGPAMWAMDLAVAYAQSQIDLVANVTDTFTTVEDQTGQPLQWEDIVSAKATLGAADAEGEMVLLTHPTSWGQLEQDAITQGLAAANNDKAGIVDQQLGSYKGRWYGVDVYTSTRVPTANAGVDYASGLFAPGAVAIADVQLDPEEGDPDVLDMGRARLERVRQGTFVSTSYVLSAVFGVSKAIDGAGVTIHSAAA